MQRKRKWLGWIVFSNTAGPLEKVTFEQTVESGEGTPLWVSVI